MAELTYYRGSVNAPLKDCNVTVIGTILEEQDSIVSSAVGYVRLLKDLRIYRFRRIPLF